VLKKVITALVGAFTIASLSATASAATLVIDGSGQLIGATSVNVGGSLYDVSFAQCNAGPGGFTSACTPYFHTSADATLAAQALLDQVFIDSGSGMFDSNPGLTLFCGGSTYCLMAVPYTGAPSVDSEAAFNTATTDSVSYTPWYYNGSPFMVALNVAVFTPAVPEPSTWMMLLLGFAGIGISVRRRRSNQRSSPWSATSAGCRNVAEA
jgi:hypothetical protein